MDDTSLLIDYKAYTLICNWVIKYLWAINMRALIKNKTTPKKG